MKRNAFKILLNLFLLSVLCVTTPLPGTARAQSRTLTRAEAVAAVTNYMEQKYGVTFVYKDLPEPPSPRILYTGAEPDDQDKLFDYLKLFYQELAKYPQSFFHGKDLKIVVFVKKLFVKEKPAEGLFSYQNKVIFFDFLRNDQNALAQRHSIHHEFYHMMDVMQPGWRDPVWDTFNEPGFSYGPAAVKNREAKRGRGYKVFREQKGFITPYSMTSAEEDKAEIYASLMIESQNAILQRWMQDDAILNKKTRYIQNRIKEFCPDMDDAYWQQLFLDDDEKTMK
jgi:hypothetical protein